MKNGKVEGLWKIASTHNILKHKIAYSYQIVFKGKDNFFEAQNQVLKAIKYSEPISTIDEKSILIYPVIIYDGKIFECNLTENDLEVSPIECIRYLSSGIPEQPMPIYIDVMTLDFFPKYLEEVEQEVLQLKDTLENKEVK